MGIDNIPVGPEMFERWAGQVWGLRVWRVFFGIVVFGIVGGIAFAGWKAYRQVWPVPEKQMVQAAQTKTVYVPTADPAQAAEIADLRAKLEYLEKQPRPAPPKPASIGSVSGTNNAVSVGQQGGLTVGSVGTLVSPDKPDRALDDGGKKQLLSLLPPVAKVKIIHIGYLYGEKSNERYNLAKQIANFLQSAGYNVDPNFSAQIISGSVDPGVLVFPDNTDPTTIQISVHQQ